MRLPRGCLTIYTLRDSIIPLVRSKASPRTKMKLKKLKRYPGCQPHPRIILVDQVITWYFYLLRNRTTCIGWKTHQP